MLGLFVLTYVLGAPGPDKDPVLTPAQFPINEARRLISSAAARPQ